MTRAKEKVYEAFSLARDIVYEAERGKITWKEALEQLAAELKTLTDNIDDEIEINIGDKFIINLSTCEDDDLLYWYEGQTLTVSDLSFEDGKVWVVECDFGIDMIDIIRILEE